MDPSTKMLKMGVGNGDMRQGEQEGQDGMEDGSRWGRIDSKRFKSIILNNANKWFLWTNTILKKINRCI